jgi:transcriptional regulator of acetoin/glycerol metabolism
MACFLIFQAGCDASSTASLSGLGCTWVKAYTKIAALRQSGGGRAQAAKLLGISRVTPWKRMTQLGISANRFRD